MKIEHAAWQVSDPHAVADWYIQHLGFELRRRFDAPAPCCFLADGSGGVMIEIYNNPKAPVPDYGRQDPLVLHLALVSEDVAADKQRLVDAGATVVEELHTDAGDHIVMLRDPWQFPVQLCKRARPMV